MLLDWAIPWIMRNSESLVIAEPPNEEEPGYYGLKTEQTDSEPGTTEE
ncbi:MAG: hypothetical protein J07HN6_02402 [Halonotius sp. J07HN6]|nr:MAG: hypothetical protein J07HN6_02402 [Halonotius sp. J07HN6]